MPDWTYKQHDTDPPLRQRLEQQVLDGGGAPVLDGEGQPTWEPIDLTGATEILVILDPGEAGPTVTGVAEADADPTTGWCEYALATGDLATAGSHQVEFQITSPAGIRTVPNDSYKSLLVIADLGP